MGENNSNKTRGKEIIELKTESDDTLDNGADDVSERAPLLPDIQTLKITSPKIVKPKKSNVPNDLSQNPEAETSKNVSTTDSEVSESTTESTVQSDVTFDSSQSSADRERSNTEPSRPIKWRLIGPYQDLRISKCRRLYAKSGRKDDLALFFHNGRFYAMEAWCSHMGGPLFDGEIEDYNGKCHVMCPWHSYMFDLSTGRNEIGLQQNVPELKYEDGLIYVKYHTDLSIQPSRKPSEKEMEIPQVLNSSRKISQPVKGRSRKESVLESVMKLGPMKDEQ